MNTISVAVGLLLPATTRIKPLLTPLAAAGFVVVGSWIRCASPPPAACSRFGGRLTEARAVLDAEENAFQASASSAR
jgi:hypothetical protein